MDCLPEVHVSEGIRPSIVNRKFLNANSTSHQWVFGAIAELVDNACDPDVKASQFWIDSRVINEYICLTFTDNGYGMNLKNLHRMLSLGFSDKPELDGHKPIGRYGNGFKSGSMRIGKDALVFTRQHDTMSVGFLSQTYLEAIGSESVVVPMVSWKVGTRTIIDPNTSTKKSLSEILQHSIFNTEEELLKELDDLPVRDGYCHGTKIIIFNLKKNDDGELELDLGSVEHDMRLMSLEDGQRYDRTRQGQKNISEYRTSLRKYLSILYLKPPMQIFLRKKKVQSVFMTKVLTDMETYSYHPKILNATESILIYFGCYSHHGASGMMIYNRNRLIEAFRAYTFHQQKIQKITKSSSCFQKFMELLTKIVGVVEIDGLTPNHIKQAFIDDTKFRTVDGHLKNKFFDYCEHLFELDKLKTSNKPKDLWVQCDNSDCQKWRRLPLGISKETLPESWFCYMNPDKNYNSCVVEEEPEKDPVDLTKRGRKRNLISLAKEPLTHQSNGQEASSSNESELEAAEDSSVNVTPSKQTRIDENFVVNIRTEVDSFSKDSSHADRSAIEAVVNKPSSSMEPPNRSENFGMDRNIIQSTENLPPSSPRMRNILSSLHNCITPQKTPLHMSNQRRVSHLTPRRNLLSSRGSPTNRSQRVSTRKQLNDPAQCLSQQSTIHLPPSHQSSQSQQELHLENRDNSDYVNKNVIGNATEILYQEADIVECEPPTPCPVEVITLDDDDDDYSIQKLQNSPRVSQQSLVLLQPKTEKNLKYPEESKSVGIQANLEIENSTLDSETVQVLLKENEELKLKNRNFQQELSAKQNCINVLEDKNKEILEKLDKETSKNKLALELRIQTLKDLIVQLIRKRCPDYTCDDLGQLEVDAKYFLKHN